MYIHEAVRQFKYIRLADWLPDEWVSVGKWMYRKYPKYPAAQWNPSESELMSDQWEESRLKPRYTDRDNRALDSRVAKLEAEELRQGRSITM